MNERKLREFKQWISEGALVDELVDADEFEEILDLAIECYELKRGIEELEERA